MSGSGKEMCESGMKVVNGVSHVEVCLVRFINGGEGGWVNMKLKASSESEATIIYWRNLFFKKS